MTNRVPHCPGPWRVHGHVIKAIDHGKTFTVATVNSGRLTDEGNEANARLIAAAPELLSALELLIQAVEHYASAPEDWPEMEAAQVAIAKARGA